jgi:hypothetical protein
VRERDNNQRGEVTTARKSLLGGVIVTYKSRREGPTTMVADERVDQVLRIPEKPQVMTVPEPPHGRAEPGLTPDRQVRPALRDNPVLAIKQVDRHNQ